MKPTIGPNLRVLITSAAKKIPLINAVRSAALRVDENAAVIAGDSCNDALAKYIADDFWLMPKISEDSLSLIIEGCLAFQINVILPTRDGELQFWATHADTLSRVGIGVIISSLPSVNICLDKFRFSHFGLKKGLPIIPSALSMRNFEAPSYVVKERFGAGSRSLGLNLSPSEAVTHAGKLSAPIYQPFIKGKEFSIDAWVDCNHRVIGLVPRYRTHVVNGESEVTTTFQNVIIESQAIQIIEALALSGPVVLQGILDQDDEVHFIECNARFGGASTASIVAGLDGLFWSFLEMRGEKIDEHTFKRDPRQIIQIRIPSDFHIYDSNI